MIYITLLLFAALIWLGHQRAKENARRWEAVKRFGESNKYD